MNPGITQASLNLQQLEPSLKTTYEMESEGGPVRGAFDQSAYQQPDLKTRFYRYFQDEVTGGSDLSSLWNCMLISLRATRSSGPSGEQYPSWR